MVSPLDLSALPHTRESRAPEEPRHGVRPGRVPDRAYYKCGYDVRIAWSRLPLHHVGTGGRGTETRVVSVDERLRYSGRVSSFRLTGGGGRSCRCCF